MLIKAHKINRYNPHTRVGQGQKMSKLTLASQINRPVITITRIERRLILDDFGAPLWLSETVTKIEIAAPKAVKRLWSKAVEAVSWLRVGLAFGGAVVGAM